ncbi:MAG: rRNA maturation RNase YbeY [Bacteriovoracaceae bacterium]
MKKPILETEFRSTARLSPRDMKRVSFYLGLASSAFEELLKELMIPSRPGQTYQVSLLICGDNRIRILNRDYRNKDRPTDVLSFPSHENLRKISPAGDEVFLGDLAISVPTTRRQAKKFKISVFDEFIHLYFHGLLHLLGYDHEISEEEEKIMQKWEDRALDLISDKKKEGPKALSKKK